MKTKLIASNEFQTMPWKNGQGITSQIELFPTSAELTKNNFDWRISQAQISSANSFSQFPGYDRCMTVVTGIGLKLNAHILLKNEIYRFHGEDSIDCTLLKDPVEDLGVIFKRDSYECKMHIEQYEPSKKFKLDEGVHFIKMIGSKDILRVEGTGELLLKGESVAGLALLISIIKK